MNMPENKAQIDPVRLGPDSKFQFKCHKEVSCFTKCCRGIDIMLTPYDVILLKKRLGLSSEEFIAIYTELKLLEKTDLPVVTLKMLDDDRKSCPFVKDERGCIIYEDRPTTCRYYPLGVASLSHEAEESQEQNDGQDFFFFVKEPHCMGFEEEKEWTVTEWRRDQGVDIHDEVNAEWTDLIVRKRSFPASMKFSEKSKQMYFTGCYNLDKFRDFVFKSSFLTLYDIDDQTLEEIKEDDMKLLNFSCKWLKEILFQVGDETFKVNEEKKEARLKKKD